MTVRSWKRVEKTAGYRRAKLFLKRLAGRELRLASEVEVPTRRRGGWWYAPGALGDASVVYSLGVGESIGFDLAVIEVHGAEVHAFDPTPGSADMLAGRDLPERFRFHPWAVTGTDGPVAFYPRRKKDGSRAGAMYTIAPEHGLVDEAIEVPGYTLPTIAARLGHARVDLLKMDIEGAEYAVIEGLLDSPLRPAQILVEFHHRFPGIGLEATAGAIDRLRAEGYRVFAVSDTGREVSFLRVP